MQILVDENIPLITVKELKIIGHDVIDIRGTEKEGLSDNKIWELCQKEKSLLITTDKGFKNYIFEKHYGILIVRLNQPNRKKIHKKIMLALSTINEKDWINRIVTMKDKISTSFKQ